MSKLICIAPFICFEIRAIASNLLHLLLSSVMIIKTLSSVVYTLADSIEYYIALPEGRAFFVLEGDTLWLSVIKNSGSY